MHYRDDRTALEARRDDLRQELADLHRKAAELRSAVHDRETIERELAAVEARLAGRAPLLENVRVASPCQARWEEMTGDDRVRRCGACDKDVYNLSAMPRDEAERLLAERVGSICVRLYRRADGTVLTADCPVGARKKRVRLGVLAAAGAGALAASAALYAEASPGDTMTGMSPIMGAIPVVEPDRYVDVPAQPGDPEAGLAVLFWNETDGPTRAPERWKVYTDGRVVHEVDRGPGPARQAVPMTSVDHVGPMLALAAELRPRDVGVVRYYDDTPHAGIRVYGTGTREATDTDLAQLREHLDALRSPAPPPR
jgi:hypothetical protein